MKYLALITVWLLLVGCGKSQVRVMPAQKEHLVFATTNNFGLIPITPPGFQPNAKLEIIGSLDNLTP